MSMDQINEEDRELITGLAVIDEQHKTLIKNVNQVIIGQSEDPSDVLNELRLLLTWSHYHFATEEEMLVRVSYPSLSRHHKEHKNFLSTLSAFNREFQKGQRKKDTTLLTFLKDWTIHHIRDEDRGFARWMKDNEITPSAGETGGKGCPPFVSLDEIKGITEIPEIDDQHVELVRLLNWIRCYSALPGHKRTWLANRIRVLYFFARYHFLSEEILQKKAGFPMAADHKVQHEELLVRAREFIEEFTHGRDNLTEGILNFFRAWILQHILVEDSRMKGMMK